jgi:catechol 2,3-dioxygenase-like lactoylglutathione lyase family enzyme
MSIVGLHHVQLAMPRGREEEAREFYGRLLGISEVAKPPHLAARGGAWFENAQLRIHLGVEEDFRPARKAHAALVVRDLPALVQRLSGAGVAVIDNEPMPGHRRVYVSDPFGNRLELIEPESPRPAPAPAVRFENVQPILRVRSLDASIDHYVRVLGFTLDWRAPGGAASVSRDGSGLMLAEGDQGSPGTWVWFGVEDVQALFQEYTAAGATIRLPPTNYPWSREIHVQDPDGHVLRFGSEPSPEQPFSDWVFWYR